MAKEYLKRVLKELDKDLRKLPRQTKLTYLRLYRYGLESRIYFNYPDKFALPQEKFDIDSIKDIRHAYFKAYDMTDNFGPLEIESAREFLLEEIRKRKAKFSKPGFLKRINDFLTDYYQSFGRSWWK